jgi:two-component system phosphate regulon sensor histidine kinase PhoR
MDNHLYRPEIQQALQKGEGSSIRYSATLGYEMMYAAVPIFTENNRVVGVLRIALSLREIETNVGILRQSIVISGLVMALTAAFLAVIIAGRTTKPLSQLTAVAEEMAAGNLDARLLSTKKDEVAQLTRAFNHMADRLRSQVHILAEERGRLAAVLDRMADGVVITDNNGQVQLINTAAARLFRTSEERALGRSLAQVAPYYPLIELWKACQEYGVEQVDMVEVSHHNLFLHAIITPFIQEGADGYLLILQDLSRVRRLETIRRDFISNISHELRTPLAGLKALVETLTGGAIKDRSAARHFLNRMDIEVDALTQIVEELLELSRIESGQVTLQIIPTEISDIVTIPVDRLRPQAERAGINLDIEIPDQLPQVLADIDQIQLVLTNIVHNAIKFTSPGGRILVSAHQSEEEAIISVQDNGVGIPAEDLPRIFERFYKADRARSGGGTGLGLAIAKHTVERHNGRIWAESIEGKGSTFYFTLPIQDNPADLPDNA